MSYFQYNENYYANAGGAASKALTYNLLTTAGNLLFVVVGWEQGTTITSLSGTTNVYTALPRYAGTTTHQMQAFYCLSCAGGAETVTVNWSGGGGTFIQIGLAEYYWPGAAIGQTAEATGSTATPSSGNIATTAAASLLLAYVDGPGTWGSGTGYTLRSAGNLRTALEDRTVAAGTYAGTFTSGNSAWTCAIAEFPAPATGGTQVISF